MPTLAALPRNSNEDARQFAYRILRISILELRMRPGEKLSEQDLAIALEMSRTPVRDVLGRLARENLVELIPQRGAFVARINPFRAEQAVWVYTQTGVAALELLYTEMVPASAFAVLEQNTVQQQLSIAAQDGSKASRIAMEFHRLLYHLAKLDLVWNAAQCANADLWRLSHLASGRRACCESALLECSGIVQGLISRDHAAACRALQHQFSRMYSLLPSLREEFPACFA